MLDTVAGLPVHVLVVHAVVVFAPLAALAAIAYVALPRRRASLRVPTLVLAAIGTAAAFIAAGSGEELEHRLYRLGQEDAALHVHTEAGDVARIVTVVFFLVVLVTLLWALRPVDPPAGRSPRLPRWSWSSPPWPPCGSSTEPVTPEPRSRGATSSSSRTWPRPAESAARRPILEW